MSSIKVTKSNRMDDHVSTIKFSRFKEVLARFIATNSRLAKARNDLTSFVVLLGTLVMSDFKEKYGVSANVWAVLFWAVVVYYLIGLVACIPKVISNKTKFGEKEFLDWFQTDDNQRRSSN